VAVHLLHNQKNIAETIEIARRNDECHEYCLVCCGLVFIRGSKKLYTNNNKG
jgi:hypothetical protein